MNSGESKVSDRAIHRSGFDPWRAADMYLALRILAKMVRIRIHLAVFDYDATSRFVARKVERVSLKTAIDENDRRFAKQAGVIANGLGNRIPIDAKCLVRALAVWWQLRKSGLPAELKLGVSKADAFAAHAWVELSGSPVTDTADKVSQYVAFDRSMR